MKKSTPNFSYTHTKYLQIVVFLLCELVSKVNCKRIIGYEKNIFYTTNLFYPYFRAFFCVYFQARLFRREISCAN